VSSSSDALLCDLPDREAPTQGLDAVVDGLQGRTRRGRGVLERLRVHAAEIDRIAPQWDGLRDGQLHERLRKLRERVRRESDNHELITQSLAGIRTAAERELGERPYPVQLMGALTLHHGWLAEMATGEGKTLTAGLAAVLAAWRGHPCHLVTVNDYLAERDANWMRPLFQACGVRGGYVVGSMDALERRTNYGQDVTYTTSKEITADFLRDRLRLGQITDATRWRIHYRYRLRGQLPDGVVMRGLHTAIIDEADSVLIDEAVTPLIISGQNDSAALKESHGQAWQLCAGFQERIDFQVNARFREVELLPPGRRRILAAAESWANRWRSPTHATELAELTLTARVLYQRDKQYVLRDGKVVIVDEASGRLMPNRKWRQGLHQAIEAKEGVEVTPADTTLARLSFQRFFRLFRRLSGMTGTASEVAGELWHVYRLPVIRIPPNRPCARRHLPDRFFRSHESKLEAVVTAIREMHRTGRPVLVGTRSVSASEELARRLEAAGLRFSLLNALQDVHEARIVADAGHPGQITIATNMAGRGTDIRLGEGVAARGGLHVIATERHESTRVDRQLFGRAGRQGDPGSAQAFVSMDDDLLQRHLPGIVRRLARNALDKNVPGAAVLTSTLVNRAHASAERQARHARTRVLRMDTWLDEAVGFTGRRVG
jgi:preprotein translocase subunit SecA